uniref:Reverse transcriptase domain-containing protein n=1 Tax=Tanacetum cinerariifolium TaxID=118510 RepID=A0A699HGL0_TANCI|nr:reverse transcriptase domain-containing protein [Tanacetum cinerariifolium]
MSTRSSARNLFLPLDNPELTIQKRSRSDPTHLNNYKMDTEGNGYLPVPDLLTMEELCQPSLNGRGGPISPIAIQETNFGLKNDMSQQVYNSCQFHGLPGDDANKYLDKFLHVTQSIKVNGVTDDALRLYLFPHSLTHHATAWFDRLLRNSNNTFEQMAKMFPGKYFPPLMITKLRNEITNFRQRGGTFMKRRLEECYDLIENMTAHHNDWDTSAQRSESSSSITSSSDTEIATLKAEMAEINKNLMRVLQPPLAILKTYMLHEPIKGNNQGRNQFFQGANQGQNQPPAYQAPAYQALVHQPQIPQPQVVTTNEFTNFIKENDAIPKNMQTNMTSLTNSNFELKNMFGQFMKMNTASSSGLGTLPGNTITNPKEYLKGITTRSGAAYQGPTIPTTSSSSPPVVELISPITDPVASPVSAPRPSHRPSIPYPSRLQDQKLRNKANDHREKFFQIFKDLNFNISFSDALILMLKFGPSIKSLLNNKDKLCELTRTLLNEHCSMIILNNLSKKLGDPGKFLIMCDFPEMAECLVLADLGASINLMPLSVWNKLSLPDLSPTCMTLELVDRLISRPVGVAEDVFVKVEVLGFFDVITSGNPTPYYDLIVSTTSSTLTPFGNSDFLLEEVDAFLDLEDDPTSSEVDQSYVDKVKLKDLPPHLEYAFLEGDDKLPVIIAKDLSMEEKTALITVMKSHKRKLHSLAHTKRLLINTCLLGYAMHRTRFKEKEMLAVVYAFEKFWSYLIMNKSIVYTDHSALKYHFSKKDSKARLLRWVLLLQEFTFKAIDTKGAENLAADHLSRLENPHQTVLDPKEINESFPLETLNLKSLTHKLNELRDQAYENSLIYKEKTKRLHDSKIKDCVFNIGDKVLLFNSRLKIFSGELKSRWSGPFTISHVFPVELSQPDGPNFKVNGHRLKHYFGEDVPKMVVPDLPTFPKDH